MIYFTEVSLAIMMKKTVLETFDLYIKQTEELYKSSKL